MPREELVGFPGNVEGTQRKVTRDFHLKDQQELTRWKNKGRAFHQREQHVQRPRRMCVIAKTVFRHLTFV